MAFESVSGTLSQARMREIAFLLPPLPEQAAIVRYLDHVDRRVRRLVRAKRKLIALLTEQKQAIIHRAVTRGLDPDVPLKDSGVEWLGEVPEHWEVRHAQTGHFFCNRWPTPLASATLTRGYRFCRRDTSRLTDGVSRTRSTSPKRTTPGSRDVSFRNPAMSSMQKRWYRPGSHARWIWTCRFQVWVHVAVLKVVKRKILPEFLAMALNSPRCYEQSQLFTRGATNQDSGLNRMKGIYLTLPPNRGASRDP